MSDIPDMKTILAKVATGAILSRDDAETAFDIIMSGNATPAQIGGFLMALRVRGETVGEIAAAARVMRAKALTLDAPEGAIDPVGTGGDVAGTYNISTGAAFVVAGAGVPVAKHGNRAVSSKSGSADVLTALGVKIDAPMELVRESLWTIGIGFLMAPRHHAAMRHVAGPRGELGTRTIFNLLGPLSNPAGARYQLLGVYDPAWVRPLAEVLGELGAERAWIVHGSDGLDELTTTGPSHVAEWYRGGVREFDIAPEDIGLQRARSAELKGGDAEINARALRAMLDGEAGPYRDVVLLNAAASLLVAGKAETLAEGVALARQSIDSGAAREKLDALIAITNRESVG
ncbi:MAG: anthranilate phosphoribosyltransferase [Rhodospirillaceae bacterium]|nr:anthranilate phosphoribosyltransferase [Rhodospirillaceae bacterium]